MKKTLIILLCLSALVFSCRKVGIVRKFNGWVYHNETNQPISNIQLGIWNIAQTSNGELIKVGSPLEIITTDQFGEFELEKRIWTKGLVMVDLIDTFYNFSNEKYHDVYRLLSNNEKKMQLIVGETGSLTLHAVHECSGNYSNTAKVSIWHLDKPWINKEKKVISCGPHDIKFHRLPLGKYQMVVNYEKDGVYNSKLIEFQILSGITTETVMTF